MPIPEKYIEKIADVVEIWEPAGYFDAQTDIWEKQSEARHQLYSAPTKDQLGQIKEALILSPEDVESLNNDDGHETNKLLRLVQSRLSPETGNFLHRGNTSSDVLDTSLAMQIIRSLGIILIDFANLQRSLASLALKYKDTLQIGRSHGQHAVPQTFGRQVLGWHEEVKRGVRRVEKATDVISFGKLSGEVGTNASIEPELEEEALRLLGLGVDTAPTQVISRDRHSEVVGLLVVNSATLARITLNIRNLSRTEIGELREPFEDSKQGSSAMPHKRNPDVCERVYGIYRRIRSTFIEEIDSMLLTEERDISHSSTERFVFPDLFGGLSYAARLTKKIIDDLEVFPERMAKNINLTHGGIYSPRLLNALIDSKEMTRTQAYDLVKPLAQQAIDTGTNLYELVKDHPDITRIVTPENLVDFFKPDFYLKNIDTAFKRAGLL